MPFLGTPRSIQLPSGEAPSATTARYPRNSLLRPLAVLLLAAMIPSLPAKAPDPDPIHAFLQPLVDDRTFAGAVTLVATKDRIVYLHPVGYRDLETKAPMQADSLFWIASTTKPMTVTAFMTLVDEGKVSLDDPVEKYLPEFHGQMVAAKGKDPTAPAAAPVPADHPIRIREILSHTSGLPFRSKAQVGALDALPLKDAVHSFAAEPLNYQPGTDYAYSNEGINTAARIIEVVTGVPHEQFLQQRLFDPLGMNETTFWPTAAQVKRIAISYKNDEATGTLTPIHIDQLTYPLDDRAHRFPMPAGGLFSTAADVAKFAQMILNGGMANGHRIVSEASIREMTSRQNKGLGGTSYGLGWSVSDTGFGHGGAYNNAMEIDRTKGRILIFMVQQSGPYGTPAGKAIVPTLEKLADQLAATDAAHP
jgi:CubicO group peptidase (beta-lactamase class C family)